MEIMRPDAADSRCAEKGFSLLELLLAVTLTALLSTAVVASFQIGLRSWRRGEDFVNRSQRLSAVTEMMQKQMGSMTAFFPVKKETVLPPPGQPAPFHAPAAPSFVGASEEMIFVSVYPMTAAGGGGLQAVRYALALPADAALADGKELRVASQPLFRRDDFSKIAETLSLSPPNSVTLLTGVEDLKFQYWVEEQEPATNANPNPPRRRVAVDQWDTAKHNRLPEAVFIHVRFVKARGSTAEYNRESFDLLVPINVSKVE